MNTMYKYKLDLGITTLTLPAAYTFRYVGEQDRKVYVWAEVNTSAPEREVRVQIIGTGHPMPKDSFYVGTVQMQNGLVWHVYEL